MQGTGTAAVIVLPKVSTVISVLVDNDYNIPKSEFVFLKRTFSISCAFALRLFFYCLLCTLTRRGSYSRLYVHIHKMSLRETSHQRDAEVTPRDNHKDSAMIQQAQPEHRAFGS